LSEFVDIFYTPVFKTGRIMVYQCPTVRPSVSHVAYISYINIHLEKKCVDLKTGFLRIFF